MVYFWYQTSSDSCSPFSEGVCQRDIINFWAPIIGLSTLLLLLVLLYNWLLVMRVVSNLKEKNTHKNVKRIGSRVMLRFEDTSHGDIVTGISLGGGSELAGCACPYETSTRF